MDNNQFFQALFGNSLNQNGGFIELERFKPYAQVFCRSIDETINNLDNFKVNGHFGVCPRKELSGKKEAVSHVVALWADIDYGEEGHKGKTKFETHEEAFAAIDQFEFRPSIIVSSGHGFQVYWLLDQPVAVEQGNVAKIEGILKGIHATIGSDAVHDLSRVFKIPGTINQKLDKDGKTQLEPWTVVIIKLEPDLKYSLDTFAKFQVETNLEAKSPEVSSTEDVVEVDVETLNISQETKNLILTGKVPGDRYKSESEADFRVICDLLKASYDDALIVKIFQKYPIGAKFKRQGMPYLDHSIKKAQGLITVHPRPLFPVITADELCDVLGLTIKEDNANKLITFLGMLAAYTDSCQFNVSFNSPSSTGKSYIPIELKNLFPAEDVQVHGYCSPTGFFHDVTNVDDATKMLMADLSRKILIFTDQPHNLLLEYLRPLLSHDQKEMFVKITDKTKGAGLRTKNVSIKGFPSVFFCSAGLRFDEQEVTRFFLLSPEINQSKIQKSIEEKIRRESNPQAYLDELERNPARNNLKARIKAIKNEKIRDVILIDTAPVAKVFLSHNKKLKSRSTRDVGRFINLVKASALLNLWSRERMADGTIFANEDDIEQATKLWQTISEAQEFNLPVYVFNVYKDVILPLLKARDGSTRQEIVREYRSVYGNSIADTQLQKTILPMLESANLIFQAKDQKDNRNMLVYLVK
ncbi:MAG: hypothetical protein HQL12_03050 [Candidatus Omnitrophica bacterium]|nr:hypothetical protein [Candidatus Omnitrophota bacterium]